MFGMCDSESFSEWIFSLGSAELAAESQKQPWLLVFEMFLKIGAHFGDD